MDDPRRDPDGAATGGPPAGSGRAESRVHRGRRAEAAAAEHLVRRGWRVLDRNWRDGPRELDLVASRGDVLAFVEVKARSGSGWGHPLEGVTRRKRREVERAARAWLREHPFASVGLRIRFDAVAVHLRAGRPPRIRRVTDAWRVGE